MTDKRTLQQWLAAAYGEGAGCPPAQVFLAEEWAALTNDRRELIERHLGECPACAAELELARAFDAGAMDGDARWIVEQLERSRPGSPAPGESGDAVVVPLDSARHRRARWLVPLAAAAMMIVAVGLVVRLNRPTVPELPDRPSDGVVRSAEIEILAPVGDIEAPPTRVEWVEVGGVRDYRFVLLDVDDEPLWEGRFDASPAVLPDSIVIQLQPGVVYFWQIEGRSEGGEVVARSARQQFRMRPSAAD